MIKKTKKNPKGAGRNSVITPEVVRKLEDCFANSLTDEQACVYVGISKPALYDYCKKYPKFLTKKEELKKRVDIKAKMNIVKSIINDGNISDSKWWAERKSKDEFSIRTEQTGKDGKDLIPDKIIRDDIITKK